jgi:Uma2 family endonuclease
MSTPNTPRVPRMPTEEGDLWRLSVDRYERMVASGIITQDDRVELLEGVLVNKMSKSPEHVLGTILVTDVLRAMLPAGWLLRSEQPVRMDDSEPEPDASVVRGPARNYGARHPIPAEVALVIEVADSSLRRDREDKRRIYARNGIAVYWIVNVADRLIDVFTDPSGPVLTPDYATIATYRPDDVIPVIIAGTQIGTVPVADLLP